MTGAELADVIERLCANYDAVESAWRANLKNEDLWDSFALAKCRLADVTRGNLPAILAALRSERPAGDVEAVERAMTNGEIEQELDRLYVAFATDYEDIGRFVCEHIEAIRAALAAAQEGPAG